MRRTALTVAALAAAGAFAAPASAATECVFAEPFATACVVVNTDKPCVGVSGHVDVFPVRVACSPR